MKKEDTKAKEKEITSDEEEVDDQKLLAEAEDFVPEDIETAAAKKKARKYSQKAHEKVEVVGLTENKHQGNTVS